MLVGPRLGPGRPLCGTWPDHRGDQSHFAQIYGASVSKETISRITDKVLEEMNDWARLLDAVYAAVFIHAIVVKVRGDEGDDDSEQAS